MKNTYITLVIAMIAGYASAQIWSENFSTNTPPSLNDDSFAQITNEYATGEWTTVGGTVTNDHLRLIVNNWSGQKGMTWGTSIALDDSLLTAAGNYRLTLDIAGMQTDATLGIRVYDAAIGSGTTNNYYEIGNYQWGVGVAASVVPYGDATTNLLSEAYLNASHQGGIRSVDFSYDGSGDVVLLLMAMSETSSDNRWVEVDAISVDVAIANSDVPSFTSPSITVLPEALENEVYSNTAFVASVTSNPGGESLVYSSTESFGLSVSPDGVIYGTPTKGGTNTLLISVADADGASDDAIFTLVVTNVNDAPVFSTAYGDHEFWAGDAVVGFAYSADLNGYMWDEEGDTLTFSGSGPAWLDIAANGALSGTPATNDWGNNSWEVIVDDGMNSSTGTLNIAVKSQSIVQLERFDGPTFVERTPAQLATFPSPDVVNTTVSNGTWYGYFSAPLNGDGTMSFYRVNQWGQGIGSRVLCLDDALFVDGAGTYEVSFNITSNNANTGSATLYMDVYDLDLSTGEVTAQVGVWGAYGDALPPVAATGGATASLITNATWSASASGVQTMSFDYDGTGDVLIHFGAGSGKDWWKIWVDDFMVLGPKQVLLSKYELLVKGLGLSGNDALATTDYDGDGVNNLLEYAFGGDITNAANSGSLPAAIGTSSSGGTNWMEFVHVERTDDAEGLTYGIDSRLDLTQGDWAVATDAVVKGAGPEVNNLKTVTNAVPTDGKTAEFIHVSVELN